jgi:hypothetical protein
MGMGGQRHAPAALPQGKGPGTNCAGGGWDPRSVWTGAENLARTGVRSQDRPDRSESQYRLSYPGPHCVYISVLYMSLIRHIIIALRGSFGDGIT